MCGTPSDPRLFVIKQIESLIVQGGPFAPYWGWHDDHRDADGTADYLPALQQVRAEFYGLVDIIPRFGRCLQLGAGHCDAPHAVLRCLFDHVTTIDWRVIAVDDEVYPGADTASGTALGYARSNAPYDLLFIDAGHSYQDVGRDHYNYASLVRAGGIVAFHDALPRPAYPEVEVWRYLASLGNPPVIGEEVGVAWIKR